MAQKGHEIVKWETETIDLGEVGRDEKVPSWYSFINISNENVEIDIVSTCECTKAKWTKGVIKPGEKGVIDIVFDSSQKEEAESVDVDVYFKNTDDTGAPYSTFLSYTFAFKD